MDYFSNSNDDFGFGEIGLDAANTGAGGQDIGAGGVEQTMNQPQQHNAATMPPPAMMNGSSLHPPPSSSASSFDYFGSSGSADPFTSDSQTDAIQQPEADLPTLSDLNSSPIPSTMASHLSPPPPPMTTNLNNNDALAAADALLDEALIQASPSAESPMAHPPSLPQQYTAAPTVVPVSAPRSAVVSPTPPRSAAVSPPAVVRSSASTSVAPSAAASRPTSLPSSPPPVMRSPPPAASTVVAPLPTAAVPPVLNPTAVPPASSSSPAPRHGGSAFDYFGAPVDGDASSAFASEPAAFISSADLAAQQQRELQQQQKQEAEVDAAAASNPPPATSVDSYFNETDDFGFGEIGLDAPVTSLGQQHQMSYQQSHPPQHHAPPPRQSDAMIQPSASSFDYFGQPSAGAGDPFSSFNDVPLNGPAPPPAATVGPAVPTQPYAQANPYAVTPSLPPSTLPQQTAPPTTFIPRARNDESAPIPSAQPPAAYQHSSLAPPTRSQLEVPHQPPQLLVPSPTHAWQPPPPQQQQPLVSKLATQTNVFQPPQPAVINQPHPAQQHGFHHQPHLSGPQTMAQHQPPLTPTNQFQPPYQQQHAAPQPNNVQQRPWTPPPAHPLVCFGFGGRLLTVLPRAPDRSGPVTIQPLSELLESQPFYTAFSNFPGPLTAPTNGAPHARHSDVENLVQRWADDALFQNVAQGGGESSLVTTLQSQGLTREQVQEGVQNERNSKRLLYLLILEMMKTASSTTSTTKLIHRSQNPSSLTTLPCAPVPGVTTIEENMIRYLVQLPKTANGNTAKNNGMDGEWLDNASASHTSDCIIPAPGLPQPLHDELLAKSDKQHQVLDQLQLLLMHGQRKEACQLALDHELYSHALLLASFDMATYHTVVGRFALSQFKDGVPLQSLYLLFAQQPSGLFRGIPGPDGHGMDGKLVPGPYSPLFTAPNTPPLMRHWRSNLSVLLANPTPNDKQVLTTLGDTLWQNYYLTHAAHMVYVLAGHALGPEVAGSVQVNALPAGRILLLGADHRKYIRTFVTPESVQLTEIWEYTRQLAAAAAANANTSSSPSPTAIAYSGHFPALQLFKLHYAYQLAEYGFSQRALAYTEQLTNFVNTNAKNGSGGTNPKGTLIYPPCFLNALESLDSRLRELLNAKVGPGIGKRLVGKLIGWMVGDSAQAPGTTTTTVAPTTPNGMDGNNGVGSNGLLHPPVSTLSRSASQTLPRPAHHTPSLTASASTEFLRPPTSSPQHVPMDSSHQNMPPIQQGHSPLNQPKHVRSVTEGNAPNNNNLGATPPTKEGSQPPSPSPSSDDPTKAKAKKTGIFGSLVGRVGSILGGGSTTGKKVHKAHLREESVFEWDEATGKYVQKDTNGNIIPPEEEDVTVAPPTISDEMKAKLMNAAGPPLPAATAAGPGLPPSPSVGGALGGVVPPSTGMLMSLPGMPPPPSSMFASRGGGTKNRYALADSSWEDASSNGGSQPMIPTPGLPSMFPTPANNSVSTAAPGSTVPSPMPGVPPPSMYPSAQGGGMGMGMGMGAPAFRVFRPAAASLPDAAGGVPPQNESAPHDFPSTHLTQQQQPPSTYTPPPTSYAQQQQQHGHPHPHPHLPPPSAHTLPHPQQAYDVRAQSTPPMRPGGSMAMPASATATGMPPQPQSHAMRPPMPMYSVPMPPGNYRAPPTY